MQLNGGGGGGGVEALVKTLRLSLPSSNSPPPPPHTPTLSGREEINMGNDLAITLLQRHGELVLPSTAPGYVCVLCCLGRLLFNLKGIQQFKSKTL